MGMGVFQWDVCESVAVSVLGVYMEVGVPEQCM